MTGAVETRPVLPPPLKNAQGEHEPLVQSVTFPDAVRLNSEPLAELMMCVATVPLVAPSAITPAGTHMVLPLM